MPDNGISSAFPPPAAATRALERNDTREAQAPARDPAAGRPEGAATAAPRDNARGTTSNPPEVVVELRQTGTPENDVEPARDPQVRPGAEARPDRFEPAADNTPRGPVQVVEAGGVEDREAAVQFTPSREDLRNQGNEAQAGAPQTAQTAFPPAEPADVAANPTPPVETVLQNAENPVAAQVSVERAVETPPAEAPNPVRENLQTPAVRAERIQAPEPAETPATETPTPLANREPATAEAAPTPEAPEPVAATETATPAGAPPAAEPEPRLNTLEQLTRPSPEDLIGINVDVRA